MTKPRCFLAETMQILFCPQGQVVRSIRPTDSPPDLRGARERVGMEKENPDRGAIRVGRESWRGALDGAAQFDFFELLYLGARLMAFHLKQTGTTAEHAVELVDQE